MGQHLPDYKITEEWVDITTLPEYADLVGANATIQAKWVNRAFIFIGGTSAPEPESGFLLTSTLSLTTTIENCWVMGSGGSLSIFLED